MAITKIQSGAIPPEAIDTTHIGDVGADKITGQIVTSQITDSAIHTDKVSDLAVTHAKLHTDMDLSGKTVTLPTIQHSLNIDDGSAVDNSWNTLAQFHPSVSDGPAEAGIRIQSYPSTTSVPARMAGIQSQSNTGAALPLALNKDGGNVGIGTTDPQAKLEVDGIVASINSGQGAGQLQLQGYGGTGYINMNGTGNLIFRMGSSYTERARFHPEGYLELKSSDAYNQLVLTPAGTNAPASINFNTPGTGRAKLKVQNNEYISILSTGNVGIGKTNPEGSLHVTGYRDGQGNGANDTTLMLSSTSTAAGGNSANGPESLKFKGYGHNYNGDVTGIPGSNEINFEMYPTWKYWGEDNSLSPYGQSHPVMDFKTKGSNETAASNILRMMGYGKRLVGTMYTGSSDINKQMTKGAVNLLPQLGRFVGTVGHQSTGYLADMLGTGNNDKGVYLVFINGGGSGNGRDTGIYVVTYSSATDIYDSGLLVTEQLNNMGLNVQAVNASGNIDHRFFTITTWMRGYDTCYGNCGSFVLNANGSIVTGGAYGGCSVWAVHLGGESRGGNTLWEG